jgi:hypothetical protein
MTDRNHIVRAHRLSSLADLIEHEGLAGAIKSVLRGETSITDDDADEIGTAIAGLEPSLVDALHEEARVLRRRG